MLYFWLIKIDLLIFLLLNSDEQYTDNFFFLFMSLLKKND
jgi:hypothetical protein